MSENSIIKKDNTQVRKVLQTSLYPGAADESVDMVLAYCEVAKLDVMQKPVHIVPMWDSKAKVMKDVIMPGIGLYRIQAARTGQYMGMSEPEHGPDITENIGGVTITFPLWTKVTVKRLMDSGLIAEFSAKEYWKENYAVKGGQEKSIAPNAMWTKRPYGQNAKCAEAQALRKAFPELGSAPTADEMEGKEMINVTPDATAQVQSGTLATAEELKARAAQRAQQQKEELVIIEQPANESIPLPPEFVTVDMEENLKAKLAEKQKTWSFFQIKLKNIDIKVNKIEDLTISEYEKAMELLEEIN